MSHAGQWHVALTGDDTNPGTEALPWRTLERAQQAVRQHLANSTSDEPNTIWIHGGEYQRSSCWTFGLQDSGRPGSPTIWRAVPGEEVVISGATTSSDPVTIPHELLSRLPVSAQSNATGWLVPRETMNCASASWREDTFAKVAADSIFMRPARTPNEQWADGSWSHEGHFQSDILPTALHASEAWLHGFFAAPWADSRLAIGIDQDELTSEANRNEIVRHRGVHAIEFLDQVGEWYYDRDHELLITWMPDDAAPAITQTDALLAVYDAHDLHFSHLTFQQSTHIGIELVRSHHIELEGCTVRGVGDTGVHLYGGSEIHVTECDIEHMGRYAVRVEAGDRTTLVPCQHTISHCRIHDFGRSRIGFSAAIYLAGVGSTVANCGIWDGSDAAIRIDGNDHQVVFNEIRNVCKESVDTGAIYLGHDWTERGNVIRRNLISDVGHSGMLDVMGIYLDDFASGTVIEENVIRNVGRAIAVGGGRDNQVSGNVIVNCPVGIQLDSRGQTWAAERIDQGDDSLKGLLQELGASRSLYMKRYPELEACESDSAGRAIGNRLERNVLIESGGIALDESLDASEPSMVNNLRHPQSPNEKSVWNLEQLTKDSTVRSVVQDTESWLSIGPRSSATQLISNPVPASTRE
ncbi:hypothetical protein Pla100_58270 [Neorhodopirellula pilleata]|uniref:Right handed beta helix domain-containing protein n=2 Tax=Neorhodopirellula pilleata TaxID=2714738 RepID=A0A5C5ZL15_9BACT|nr:hypothetical protein Pla100_58270 [Neorhodopirellula pilleata]